jgi:hypothetical protein
MAAIKFHGVTKHGRNAFVPSTPLGFEDPGAIPFFVAAGFGEETDEEPVMTYPEGTVEIDPNTVFADGPNKGKLVIAEGTDNG